MLTLPFSVFSVAGLVCSEVFPPPLVPPPWELSSPPRRNPGATNAVNRNTAARNSAVATIIQLRRFFGFGAMPPRAYCGC